MRLDFKIGFIVVIVIPLLICTLAIINGNSLYERYYSCLKKHNEQQCHTILE
jgi:hypothetical protein